MKNRNLLRRSMLMISLLLTSTIFSFAQNNFPVTGKVIDNSGRPLESVSVQVKGTNVTTITKQDGSYSINAPSGSSVLVFSSVGFVSTEVPINSKGTIDLSMLIAENSMDNVVVIGYGSRKKADVTGAVSSI